MSEVSSEGGPVIVFDSGMGGLTVLAALRRILPALDVVYVADDAAFPYGGLAEAALAERVLAVLGGMIAAHRPRAVVIACNSASTLVLKPLRAAHGIPFVGTVPAIKPAAAATRSGLVSVLATPGTVARDYTRALIAEFGGAAEVTLVGAPGLAAIAERAMGGSAVPLVEVTREIAPAFVERAGARTDTVVLACTHYPLLVAELRAAAPWQVDWIDPAPAIARRLASILTHSGGTGACAFVATSGADIAARARGALARLLDTAPAPL